MISIRKNMVTMTCTVSIFLWASAALLRTGLTLWHMSWQTGMDDALFFLCQYHQASRTVHAVLQNALTLWFSLGHHEAMKILICFSCWKIPGDYQLKECVTIIKHQQSINFVDPKASRSGLHSQREKPTDLSRAKHDVTVARKNSPVGRRTSSRHRLWRAAICFDRLGWRGHTKDGMIEPKIDSTSQRPEWVPSIYKAACIIYRYTIYIWMDIWRDTQI